MQLVLLKHFIGKVYQYTYVLSTQLKQFKQNMS